MQLTKGTLYDLVVSSNGRPITIINDVSADMLALVIKGELPTKDTPVKDTPVKDPPVSPPIKEEPTKVEPLDIASVDWVNDMMTFNFKGGDGTAVLIDAPGITVPKVGPIRYTESKIPSDLPPVKFKLTQSGVTKTVLFDMRTVKRTTTNVDASKVDTVPNLPSKPIDETPNVPEGPVPNFNIDESDEQPGGIFFSNQ